MAPLETTTNAAAGRAAIDDASRANTPRSPASVREPIFTTTRRARPSDPRASTMAVREQVVERRIEAPDEPGGNSRCQPQHAVDERRHCVALVVDHRRLIDLP